jgi:hypothetical protein
VLDGLLGGAELCQPALPAGELFWHLVASAVGAEGFVLCPAGRLGLGQQGIDLALELVDLRDDAP